MHDWSITEDERVLDLIDTVATRVARGMQVDKDDVTQEAMLAVTDLETRLPEFYYDEQWPLLAKALKDTLIGKNRREANNRWRLEAYDEADYLPIATSQRVESPLYDRELVKALLPAVWDSEFCYGMQAENPPDKDMPRAASNKATGNTLAVHLADIRIGWERAPLSLRERQCLLLTHGLDWRQEDAGAVLGIAQPNVSKYVTSGVGKIVATLNGDAALLALQDDYEPEQAA